MKITTVYLRKLYLVCRYFVIHVRQVDWNDEQPWWPTISRQLKHLTISSTDPLMKTVLCLSLEPKVTRYAVGITLTINNNTTVVSILGWSGQNSCESHSLVQNNNMKLNVRTEVTLSQVWYNDCNTNQHLI